MIRCHEEELQEAEVQLAQIFGIPVLLLARPDRLKQAVVTEHKVLIAGKLRDPEPVFYTDLTAVRLRALILLQDVGKAVVFVEPGKRKKPADAGTRIVDAAAAFCIQENTAVHAPRAFPSVLFLENVIGPHGKAGLGDAVHDLDADEAAADEALEIRLKCFAQ